MTLSALRAVLAEQHQRLLVERPIPTGRRWAGSTRPTRAARAASRPGRPRDQIIGVSFVTSEGAVVKGGGRVVKNVAGYDFPKLLTGSMGTLGIITQMTLKVRPIPEASAIVWVPFRSWPSSPTALERLNTSGTRPIALELLNGPAARTLAERSALLLARAVLGDRLRGQRRVGRLADRSPEGRAGRSRSRGRRGRPRGAALGASPSFRRRAGPVSFVANLRPSSVVRSSRGSTRALVRPGARRQRDRPRPRPGRWTLEPMAEQIDSAPPAGRRATAAT